MLTKEQVNALRRARVRTRNRLAQAKELAGVTQVQIAAKTGFTQSYVSKIENGEYGDLPGETMRTFSDYFGCQIEDLFPAREAVAS